MKRKQTWLPTKIPNLFMLKETGTYYLRVKPKGKSQIRISLKTTNIKVAKPRMRTKLLELGVGTNKAKSGTWASLVEPWQIWLQGEKVKQVISDSTIEYKMELLDQIRATWKDWDRFELEDLTEGKLASWVVTRRGQCSPTRTKGAMTVLRELLAIAVRDKILPRPDVELEFPNLSVAGKVP